MNSQMDCSTYGLEYLSFFPSHVLNIEGVLYNTVGDSRARMPRYGFG